MPEPMIYQLGDPSMDPSKVKLSQRNPRYSGRLNQALQGEGARPDVPSECVFCDIIAGEAPAPRHFNTMDEHSVVFEPLNPVTAGHLLVVPKRHVRDAAEDIDLTAKVMRAAAWMAKQWTAANIITSIGADASQTQFHLHIHVVPRRPDDGLALPWTGQQSASTHLNGELT